MQLQIEAAAGFHDLEPRTRKSIVDRADQRVCFTDLDDRLQRRGQVSAVPVQHRSAGADLALPHGRVDIGAELVVEPPAADLFAHSYELRGAYRVQHFGQHTLVRSQRTLEVLPGIPV